MGLRELAADLDDLLRALALGEDDLREPDAPKAVEIERVVLAAHFSRSYRDRKLQRETDRKYRPLSSLFESYG
jgi:hypothetical protein